MRIPLAQQLYQEGEEVYAKEEPLEKLLIRRYVDRIYYCTVVNSPEANERVYFQRELIEKET